MQRRLFPFHGGCIEDEVVLAVVGVDIDSLDLNVRAAPGDVLVNDPASQLAIDRKLGAGIDRLAREDRRLVEESPCRSLSVHKLALDPAGLRLVGHPAHHLTFDPRHRVDIVTDKFPRRPSAVGGVRRMRASARPRGRVPRDRLARHASVCSASRQTHASDDLRKRQRPKGGAPVSVTKAVVPAPSATRLREPSAYSVWSSAPGRI